MKRSMVLSVVIGSLILVMSLGANAYQHSQVKQAQQQISRLQQQKRQVSQQLTKTNQQKQLLSTQVALPWVSVSAVSHALCLLFRFRAK